MKRSTLDKLLSATGLIIAIALLAGSGGLFFTYSFIHSQVHNQLAAERITFPEANSEGINALPEPDRDKVAQYAGQDLLTGAQAKVFADNYIAIHLKKIGGGKTYSELSAASMADPTNTQLAGQVSTVFRGETLRGLLLNVYAFDTMAVVAKIAAFGALIASIILFVLVILGFKHAGVAQKKRR